MPMTNQQVFDKVANHLRKQGVRAVNSEKVCLYRTEEGLTCAVGCLIPKRDYRKAFEGWGGSSLINGYVRKNGRFLNVPPALKGLDSGLLAELQDLHDEPRNWGASGFNDAGERALEHMATGFGLTYTPPKES